MPREGDGSERLSLRDAVEVVQQRFELLMFVGGVSVGEKTVEVDLGKSGEFRSTILRISPRKSAEEGVGQQSRHLQPDHVSKTLRFVSIMYFHYYHRRQVCEALTFVVVGIFEIQCAVVVSVVVSVVVVVVVCLFVSIDVH